MIAKRGNCPFFWRGKGRGGGGRVGMRGCLLGRQREEFSLQYVYIRGRSTRCIHSVCTRHIDVSKASYNLKA